MGCLRKFIDVQLSYRIGGRVKLPHGKSVNHLKIKKERKMPILGPNEVKVGREPIKIPKYEVKVEREPIKLPKFDISRLYSRKFIIAVFVLTLATVIELTVGLSFEWVSVASAVVYSYTRGNAEAKNYGNQQPQD